VTLSTQQGLPLQNNEIIYLKANNESINNIPVFSALPGPETRMKFKLVQAAREWPESRVPSSGPHFFTPKVHHFLLSFRALWPPSGKSLLNSNWIQGKDRIAACCCSILVSDYDLRE
jgi:hypothetical protein